MRNSYKLKGLAFLSFISAGTICLYACGTGGSAVSSSSAEHGSSAYISDFNGNKLLKCAVNTQNGQLVNCQNIAQANTLNAPTGIAIKDGQIYVNNSGFNSGIQSVQSSNVQCILSNGALTLSGCLVAAPSGISNPIGFTINGNYAYIANYFGGYGYTKPGSYTVCSITPSTGNLTACRTESAPNIGMAMNATPETITINTATSLSHNVAYVTDQQNAGYSFCEVSNTNGRLTNCKFERLVAGAGGVIPIGPRQMTIIGNYAYFAISGNTGGGTAQYDSAYTVCQVSQDNGILSNCSTQQTSPGMLNSPTSIAVNGDYVYITNEEGPAGESGGYSYTMCSVGDSGFLTNCNNYIPQGIDNNKVGNVWLTYIAFAKN